MELVYHNIHTLPTSWIKTHHITPHRPNNFNPQDFNNYQFNLFHNRYLHNCNRSYDFNCYRVIVTQVRKFVHLYCCNKYFTLKMAGILAETCW
jgi:hypothetical protein